VSVAERADQELRDALKRHRPYRVFPVEVFAVEPPA
jgi:hypothetical protein